MKKYLLLATSALLLLAGCAKDEQEQIAVQGDSVTFNVYAENATSTKAVQDQDGAAAGINHWVMEVRDSDGDVYARKDEDGTAGEKTHTFNVKLVKDHTYTVLFWADTKNTYNTADLTDVKLLDGEAAGYAANNDRRDAFSAVVSGIKCTGAFSQDVTLKRPFGQLNIIFTDLKALYEDMESETEYLKFQPCSLKVTAKVPTSFNVKTQTAGAPATTALNITAESDYKSNYATHRAEETIFMDYFFATAGSKDVVDLGFSFVSRGETTTHSFTAVPFQRNYRTNIKGDLMTAGASWNVTVDPVWDGEIDRKIASVGSIAAANDSLAAGVTHIIITSPTDAADAIVFPAASANQSISFKISGATNSTITFKNADGTDGPSNLFITSDSQNLDINCPNTHVEVLTGTYAAVTATTSATSLIVGKDVTIENLTINGGNAEIHGIVNAITKADGSTVTYRIETVAALKKLRDLVNDGTWTNGKVYLESDIDLNDEEWTPIKAYKGGQGVNYSIDLDGQNHTISNLKITGSSAFSYIGFFSEATGLTVKDLTFNGAKLEWPLSVGVNARGGILVGNVWGINAENVAVKNATIKAYQKVGSLIGFIEGDTNVPNTVKNCSAENVSLSNSNTSESWGIFGGLIGHISQYQNPVTTISGCSVKDITISDFFNGAYTIDRLQEISHLLVASVCQNYTGDETPTISSHSIVFDNNTISGTNTVLPTCIYSSKYFGWGGNAEERPAWKGYIYVDGEKWVPDYSFECGGVKYATLDQAIAAVSATADKTVRIIKAGEYAVQQLNAKDCTIEATVDDVVFNHTAGSWITSGDCATVTVKNITWNVGNADYQMMYANLEGCTVNGLFATGATQTFKGCNFVNHEGYNMWVYGTDATFDNCTFTCPGKNDGVSGAGSAINVYNEGTAGGVVHNLVVNACTFTAENSSNKYSAIYIKPEVPYNVTITNSTANDKFFTNAISGSKVWGLKNNTNKTHTVTVDGKLVYANGSMLVIGTAAQLVDFAAAVNDGSTFAGKTITLDADVDLSGITYITAGSESKHFAGTFDGQNHTISNLSINNESGDALACTGLFGWLDGATVKDVNVSTASVTGHHYTAVIAGMMVSEQGTCTVSGCTVTGATLSCTHINDDADGDKCGGIVAYCGNPSCYVQNCTITNSTISAGRDAGQVVGAGKEAQVTGCSATDVTVSANDTSTGANIRNEVIGRVL